jgi:hypothetical protein
MKMRNRRFKIVVGAVAAVAAFAMTAAAQREGRGFRQGAPDGPRGLRGMQQEDGQPWGGPPPGGPGRRGPSFEELDTNGDGFLTFEEASVLPRMNEEHFDFLDLNGDGVLDETEFPPRRGVGGRRGPRLLETDINGDGVITWDEASVLPGMTVEHFNFLDRDGDGVISQDELPLGPPPGQMGPRRPPFEELDTNGDGVLSYEEASVLPRMTEEHFAQLDANGDGVLSLDELPVPRGPRGPHAGRQRLQLHQGECVMDETSTSRGQGQPRLRARRGIQ